jgi:hypothetical protein
VSPPKLSSEPRPISLANERLRVLLFGEPGVGKTTFGLTWPRPFVIDTDGGLISGAIQGMEGISFEPTGWGDFEALYWWAKERRDRFDTIVIDSVTTLQRLLLDEIVDSTTAVKTPEKPIMEFVPEQGQYLANQRQLARILTDLRRLDKHLVVTAGVRDRLGRRMPDVAPGMATILAHWSSVIGELVVQTRDRDGKELAEPVRALLTAPSSDRATKSRFRSLTPYVVNPTYPEIWKRVSAEYAAAIQRNSIQPKE